MRFTITVVMNVDAANDLEALCDIKNRIISFPEIHPHTNNPSVRDPMGIDFKSLSVSKLCM